MEKSNIICDGRLTPSKEERQKIMDLQLLIEECLAGDSSLKEPVRQALFKYSKDHDMLLKFVRGRKQDLKKALASAICLTNVKHSMYPELFPSQVPNFVQYVFKNEVVAVLKNRDQLGRTVILFSATKWNVNNVSLEEIICAGRYLVDMLLDFPEFLQKGAILLLDCKGASLSQAKHFTIPTIMKFVNVFWQAYPIQIKGLYLINAPLFVRPIYSIVKPFLPAKLRERVRQQLYTKSDIHNPIRFHPPAFYDR